MTQSRFPTLLWNSTLVSVSSALVSVVLGGTIGWVLGWTRVKLKSMWFTLLLVWAATPLIIQVSAWDALWGRLSWWSALVDIRYSRWFDGVLAVVWIHGFANIPWVALLVSLGHRWLPTDLEQYALTTRGTFDTFLRVTLPRLTPWLTLAGIVVAVRVFEQFEVTDVYQVRTWAEIWYLGFSLGEFRQWNDGWLPSTQQMIEVMQYPFPNVVGPNTPIGSDNLVSAGIDSVDPTAVTSSEADTDHANSGWMAVTAGVPFLLLLGSVLLLFAGLRRFIDANASVSNYRSDRLPAGRWATLFLVVIVALPLLTQLGNLLVRAGVVVEGGESHWRIGAMLGMLQYSWADYWDAGVWSFLIGLASAVTAVSVSFWICWSVRRHKRLRAIVFLMAMILFALPSPLVSLYGYRWLNLSSWEAIGNLAATSIFAPWAVLSIKHLGLAIGLWTVVFSGEASEREDLLAMDRSNWWRKFWRFGVRRYWQAAMAFGFFFLVLGAGDLSTTFATVPPGMDTFPRRILGDLHAGAGAQVAAACLIQMTLVAAATLAARYFWAATDPDSRL